MNKKIMNLFLFSIIICLLLTSCWDERFLKDHTLILAIGYDLNDDKTISKTVAFPSETVANNEQSEVSGATMSNTLTTTGTTVGDADLHLERYLSKRFDRSKARVLLLGENLAKEGIFSTLDSMYRDPRGPLSALVAVVSERAKDGLEIDNKQSVFVSGFYYDLLTSSEESGIIICKNVQSICPIILSGRKDVALPFISAHQDNDEAKIDGLALFSGDKMTGTLNIDESIMYLILTDDISKKAKFNLKISDYEEDSNKNYITIAIRKDKRKFKVEETAGQLSVNLHFHLQVEIEEFAKNHLYKKGEVGKLEERIDEQLTLLAYQTVERLQEANNDALGIGEQVRAYHNELWDQDKWRDLYPTIPFDIDFEIEIVQHGIIN